MQLFAIQICLGFNTSELSFHGVGIDISFNYPEEAYPNTEIFHNITITAKFDLTLNLFSLEISEPRNQSLELIINPTINSLNMIKDQSLLIPVNFTTNTDTSGNLFCTIHISTSLTSDYFSTSFYTTQVESVPFSELLTKYTSKLSEYDNLHDLYENLELQYGSLLNTHDTLNRIYENKINEFKALSENYTKLNIDQSDLQGNYTLLNESYSNLLTDYESLETNYFSLQTDLAASQNNENVNRILMTIFIIILVGLIFLIIYIRNKQKEPYVVIRKETVSMKPSKK